MVKRSSKPGFPGVCTQHAFGEADEPDMGHSVARWFHYKYLSLAGVFSLAIPCANALQLTVAWDSVSGATGYKVERSSNNLLYVEVASISGTSYTDTDLPSGSYSYRVRAFNTTTQSDYSNVASYVSTDVAPAITTQPVSQTATVGGSATFSVVATGSPSPTYQWQKDGVALSGATSAKLTLPSVTGGDAASYTVVATNVAGSVTSAPAVLTVNQPAPVAVAPTISTQPASQTVDVGSNVTFSVIASGSPAPAYQWRKDSVAITGATASSFTLSNASTANAGTYTVVVTNSAGSVTSSGAVLGINTIVISIPNSIPSSSTTSTSTSSSNTTTANSTNTSSTSSATSTTNTSSNTTSGSHLSGSTSSSGTNSTTTSSPAGNTSATTSSSSSSTNTGNSTPSNSNPVVSPKSTTSAASNTPSNTSTSSGDTPATPSPSSRLANASIRATGGAGDQVLIVGFVIDQAAKPVLLRAVGPGLAPYTSATTLGDPKLTVYQGATSIGGNDNWGGTAALKAAFKQTGAQQLDDTSKDAAMITTLGPKPYTMMINGSGSGMTLAEVYDLDAASGRLVNIAARAQINTGDGVLIAGFVISGNAPKQVLLRGIGPSLTAMGVSGVLARPQLDLFRGTTRIDHNEGWGGSSALQKAFAKTGAFTLSDPNSKDAALLVTLDPGTYSVIVSGVGGTTGVALVEVYDVP